MMQIKSEAFSWRIPPYSERLVILFCSDLQLNGCRPPLREEE